MALEVTRLPDETLAQFYARLEQDGTGRVCLVCHEPRFASAVRCKCGEYAFEWCNCMPPTPLSPLFSPENPGVEGVEQLSSDPSVNPELFAFTPIEPEVSDPTKDHPEFPLGEAQLESLAVPPSMELESNALPQQPEQTEQVRHESGPTPSADAPSPDASRDATKGRKRKN